MALRVSEYDTTDKAEKPVRTAEFKYRKVSHINYRVSTHLIVGVNARFMVGEQQSLLSLRTFKTLLLTSIHIPGVDSY